VALRDPDAVEAEDRFQRLHLDRDMATVLVESGSRERRRAWHPATELWMLLPDASRRRLLAIWITQDRARREARTAAAHKSERVALRAELANASREAAALWVVVTTTLDAAACAVRLGGVVGLGLNILLALDVDREIVRVATISLAGIAATIMAGAVVAVRRAGGSPGAALQLAWPLSLLLLAVPHCLAP
jgi:hypothetical protein